MLQGWKSGGMLQMLLSKTATSGVCFYLFFFFKQRFFFPAGGGGWLEGCMSARVRKKKWWVVFGCVCCETRWAWRAECRGLSDMGSVGLLGWSGCVWMTFWVKPSSNLHARQLSLPHSLSPPLSLPPTLSLSPPLLSLSLPGVTGWDIKTGILINCATLPPAALNMLQPRQAVCYISDSLVLFQLDLSHLSLSLTFTALFPSLSPLQFPNLPHWQHLARPSRSLLSLVHPSTVWP